MTTQNIERQLSALQPAGQSELAKKILAIPHRRRQRRRDCVVGFAGLLTGVAATVLVMIHLPVEKIEVPVVQYIAVENTQPPRHFAAQNVPPPREGNFRNALAGQADAEPIDLDVWIARYEKLLRNRRETASQAIVITPVVMPGGVSPLEYRNNLLRELGG
jgi:hypothetical protein